MIKKILILFFRMMPLRKAIVFESHPDFSDNSFALYEEMLRRGIHKKCRIYWIRMFRDEQSKEIPAEVSVFENEPRTLRELIRRTYILNTSRYIIDCNSFVYKRRKKQVRIHLGHGMPIKLDLEYSRKFGECDRYVVLSEFWKDMYTNQLLVPEEKLCYLGYPRNDVLVRRPSRPLWEQAVSEYHNVIVWMPTYRQHCRHMERAMDNPYPYGMPCVNTEEDMKKLHQVLENNHILLLFRPHPVQEVSLFQKSEMTHIRIADDSYLESFHMTLYDLLAHSDALVTDYSSVYFDYLLTERPIALTIGDHDEYFQYFTPAFPEYKKYIKGVYVEETGDLIRFIQSVAKGEDSKREEREYAASLFHSHMDGNSAGRIADLLVNEYAL